MKEISNNKNLKGDVIRQMQRELEAQKSKEVSKAATSKEVIPYFRICYHKNFEHSGKVVDEKKSKVRRQWTVLRSFLLLRIFFKKLMHKSIKRELEVMSKLLNCSLLEPIVSSQEALIIHKQYFNEQKKKDSEFVALNRLLKYDIKLDYVLNFEKIQKPLKMMDVNTGKL